MKKTPNLAKQKSMSVEGDFELAFNLD